MDKASKKIQRIVFFTYAGLGVGGVETHNKLLIDLLKKEFRNIDLLVFSRKKIGLIDNLPDKFKLVSYIFFATLFKISLFKKNILYVTDGSSMPLASDFSIFHGSEIARRKIDKKFGIKLGSGFTEMIQWLTYKNTKMAIFVSDKVKNEYFYEYGAKPSTVIYNSLRPINDGLKINRQGPLPKIVYVGRVKKSNRLDMLDWLIRLANQKEIKFVIICPDKKNFLKYISGPLDNIQFKESLTQDEVLSELATATLLISLSRYEGFSYAILEALITGVPVICSRSANPDYFINGYYGVVDSDLLDNIEDMRRQLSSIGRFSRDVIAKRAISLSSFEAWSHAMCDVIDLMINVREGLVCSGVCEINFVQKFFFCFFQQKYKNYFKLLYFDNQSYMIKTIEYMENTITFNLRYKLLRVTTTTGAEFETRVSRFSRRNKNKKIAEILLKNEFISLVK